MFFFIYSRPLWLISLAIIILPLVRGIIIIPKWLNNVLLFVSAGIIVYLTLLRTRSGSQSIIIQPFYSFELAKIQPELYREMLMNVFLFVPLGLFLPYLFNNKKILFSILFALLFSIIIETTQYLFSLGLYEVDDVLCNTLGASIGSLSYLVSILKNKLLNKDKFFMRLFLCL